MTLATPLPITASLAEYQAQADALHAAYVARDRSALQLIGNLHPRFLDPEVTWKPLFASDEEIIAAGLTLDDARLVVARCYTFLDWPSLETLVTAVADTQSPVHRFEHAVEAVIDGDLTSLRRLLAADPSLVHARSTRVTCQDPPVHGATLLHYVAANGVEGYRQRSPGNAVTVATMLLDAGADVNALAQMYGGDCATLPMLISSSPPADVGVQVPLVHLLLDRGAAIDGVGESNWHSPVRTALLFGFIEAAAAVVAHGARVDSLQIAAGLGDLARVRELLPTADGDELQAALALAAHNDRVAIVAVLLDAGADPNAFNPEGMHAHATPLHGAAGSGYVRLVALLLSRGARTDIRDTLWDGTPRGWAEHGGQYEVLGLLDAASQRAE
ncbi:MAG: ankyrin repeat domain-containing protein [Gemmatimonadota bacterium]